jgi:mannose-6-phosphate isomerase-like protein (cupin superfamily)
MEMNKTPVNDMKLSIANAPHYTWGDNCDSWHLLQTNELSILQESMPPGASEQLHYHQKAQQVFYILTGVATFEIDGAILQLNAGESIHVEKNRKHRILNNSSEPLSFLLVSQPKAHGDRINY